MKSTFRNGRLSCIGCLIALPWLFLVVLLAGCPLAGGNGNGNGNENTNGNGNGNQSPGDRAEIITPASSFGLSLLDPPFQVRYTVPDDATDITGYRFAVSDSSLNSPAIGDRVTIAGNLLAGANRFFDFDPSEAGVGYFRVGVSFTLDGETDSADSTGVIQVQGSPDPIFILPDQALTVVEEGATIAVSFDARDPENQVQWRLFYLDSDDSLSAPTDRIGTQLAIGQGNAGTVQFRTEGLAEGDYTLGLSATDSGMSVAATVAAGDLDRIVTVPNDDTETPKVRVVAPGSIVAPTITITNPGVNDIELFKDATFTIRFAATVPEDGATGSAEVFYDTDKNAGNGFTLIAGGLSDSDTEVEFPTGVAEGTYFIGATIRDGINAPVTDYSTGRVIVTRTVTLAVTEPNTTLPVAPNTEVSVRWETNAPDTAGTVDVFAQRLNSSNQPTGNPISIVTAGAMSLRTAKFSSTASGLFQITVRLNITGETAITANAPRPVRVSSLPAIAWLGSIAESNPRLDGALFSGVNIEDNAGSTFAKADDLDDDGLNEFVIVARYGKPFFVNPNGVGIGEAYVIYGERGSNRFRGVLNLNSVGSSSLRGVTLTGVRTISNSAITEGLSDVVSIPDVDGDGKDELAFGFPRVENAVFEHENDNNEALDEGGRFDLSLSDPRIPTPQFVSGGVVLLSSTNSDLVDPTATAPVINLDLVGQEFRNRDVTPFDRELVWEDRFAFEEGDPDAEPPEEPGCVPFNTDSFFETIRGPSVGFTVQLAEPQWHYMDRFGILRGVDLNDIFYVPPATEEGENICKTRDEGLFALTEGFTDLDCLVIGSDPGPFAYLNAGSGFFPKEHECIAGQNAGDPCNSDADCPPLGNICQLPLEPFGARIIGQVLNSRFGSSITVARPAGEDGRAELVMSAPEAAGSGIAYITPTRNLWDQDSAFPGVPPAPHQYVINDDSHCGIGWAEPIDERFTTLLVGDSEDQIQIIRGIEDINGDGRGDMAVGAPQSNGGAGRLYLVYRRQPGDIGLESDLLLAKLSLASNDPERLDGLLLRGTSTEALGSSFDDGFDFNADGVADLVVGSPGAGEGTGEVIIIFGGTGVVSEAGGIDIQTLLTQRRTASGGPVAVRIRGATVSGEEGHFGFNVANAGDVDGDGLNDLLIAAPSASPRFDADPNDGMDELTAFGVDLDLNGVRDQVPGDDELKQAGLVYLILGKNRLDQVRTCQGTSKSCFSAADCTQGTACTLTDATIGIDQLGTSRLRGLIMVGRRAEDYLGGGDAGNIDQGGTSSKDGRGRSHGLGSAGDVDGDGRDDMLIGAILADPRRDVNTGTGVRNGGEAYLIYGSNVP